MSDAVFASPWQPAAAALAHLATSGRRCPPVRNAVGRGVRRGLFRLPASGAVDSQPGPAMRVRQRARHVAGARRGPAQTVDRSPPGRRCLYLAGRRRTGGARGDHPGAVLRHRGVPGDAARRRRRYAGARSCGGTAASHRRRARAGRRAWRRARWLPASATSSRDTPEWSSSRFPRPPIRSLRRRWTRLRKRLTSACGLAAE